MAFAARYLFELLRKHAYFFWDNIGSIKPANKPLVIPSKWVFHQRWPLATVLSIYPQFSFPTTFTGDAAVHKFHCSNSSLFVPIRDPQTK